MGYLLASLIAHVHAASFAAWARSSWLAFHAAADSNFKKLGLELGGKNPIIVFADSDLEDAADGAAFGISFNTGQCCVSSSRLIVERSVAREFEALLAEKMKRIRVGDPLDETTQVGAITTEAQNTTILDYIAKGKAEGAELVTGGAAIDLGRGQYIAPTLFSGVSREMAIARDEIFGPVLCSMTFDTVEQAVELANDTVYGLAASVWTKNIDKALTVTRRVRAGRFWVNTMEGEGAIPNSSSRSRSQPKACPSPHWRQTPTVSTVRRTMREPLRTEAARRACAHSAEIRSHCSRATTPGLLSIASKICSCPGPQVPM